MRLVHLLSKKVVIARLATISGDKLAFSTVTSEMFHIQPMANYKTQVEGGVFAKTYRFYTSGDIDIQAGDRLKDNDGNYYTVKSDGVSRRSFGSIDYLIIICEKTK
jgi:hypothetical protein